MDTDIEGTLPTGPSSPPVSSRSWRRSERRTGGLCESCRGTGVAGGTHEFVVLASVATREGRRLTLRAVASPRTTLVGLVLLASAFGLGGSCTSMLADLPAGG